MPKKKEEPTKDAKRYLVDGKEYNNYEEAMKVFEDQQIHTLQIISIKVWK
jgi:hypothetical protein